MVKATDYKIIINGSDKTEQLKPLINSLTLIDNEKDDADQLTIELTKKFKRPNYSDQIKIWIGWKGQKLTFIGLFVVQSTSIIGNHYMTINASSADFSSELKQRRFISYEKNISDVVSDIASKYNLSVRCNQNFGTRFEQKNESDLAFLNRLAKEYNVVFNIKNNTLYFIDATVVLIPIGIDINSCITSDITYSNKMLYKSCKVLYHSTKLNKTVSVKTNDSKPQLVRKGQFNDETEALIFARNALKRANKATISGSVKIAEGQIIYAGTKMVIDGEKVTIKKVTHRLQDAWLTTLEF